jgi:hypothetical protein
VYNCAGKPVYQKGGDGGVVLSQPNGHTAWTVSNSDLTTAGTCVDTDTRYLTTDGNGVCPESPDGAGCVGKWQQNTHNCGGGSIWCTNPKIVVEATAARNCTGSPCRPHATACDAYSADEHVCICEFGWYGAACETQMAAAFTISGHTGSPGLNGRYTKTTRVCASKPVYQKGGDGDFVLYMPQMRSYWMVGKSDQATSCEHTGSSYGTRLQSHGYGGVCPESPDGAGCVGKWRALYTEKGESKWIHAPTIAVVAN